MSELINSPMIFKDFMLSLNLALAVFMHEQVEHHQQFQYTTADDFRRDLGKVLSNKTRVLPRLMTGLENSSHEMLLECWKVCEHELTDLNNSRKQVFRDCLDQISSILGNIMSKISVGERTERALQDFLEIAQRNQAPDSLRWAHVSLGLCCHSLELYEEAEEHLEIARRITQPSMQGRPIYRLSILVHLANCLAKSDGFKIGDREIIQRCDDLCKESMQIIDARGNLGNMFQAHPITCNALQLIAQVQKELKDNDYPHSFEPSMIIHRLVYVNALRTGDFATITRVACLKMLYDLIDADKDEAFSTAILITQMLELHAVNMPDAEKDKLISAASEVIAAGPETDLPPDCES